MKDAEVRDLLIYICRQTAVEGANQLLSVPMYCWWCWLWAATDCSGVLLQC